jgi:eukaryotic-like serine/threonine-protein kinase
MREVNVGETLDQYQLTDLLARSGMASIFKAVDTVSGKTVALKIPHPQFESDVVFFERFRREEEIGQKLDHPNIVKVLKPLSKSRMYIAMEYVDGRSLRAIMDTDGGRGLAPDRALAIAREICEALIYLHAHGVVHRDLKPENVLLTAGTQVKILDFGIALDESARRLTWFGLSNPMGTPDYMAPEQIGGRRGGARTDVYAVGMLLYEMLTGNLPFVSANPNALLRMKANEDPLPPSFYVPAIDPGIQSIILKAIERAPRDRYPGAAELLADLRDPAAVPPRELGDRPARRRGRGGAWPRRVTMPLVVVLVLAALVMLVRLSGKHSPRPARSGPAEIRGR